MADHNSQRDSTETVTTAADVNEGDTLELPTGGSLKILEAEHVEHQFSERHEFEARKPDGSTVELREHHVETALDAGAELATDDADDSDDSEPSHAELRDGETCDDDAHARRTAEQLRIAREALAEADEHDDSDDDGELATDGGTDVDAHDAALEALRAAFNETASAHGAEATRAALADLVESVEQQHDSRRVLVERDALSEGVDTLKGKLEGDVARGRDAAGYDVDAFAATIDTLEAPLSDDSDDEPRADGGFITDAAGAEWCQQCQRERINCAHRDGAE